MQTISFNGKTYNSIEEMPADQRTAYEQVMSFMKDENHNGIPDMFEGDVVQKMMAMAGTRIIINGQEMRGSESLPPEARIKFEKAMLKLSQLGINPQEASTMQTQSLVQFTPKIVSSEPASPSFTQSSSSPSAISEDAAPRTGFIIAIAVLAVFVVCALSAVGILLLNR